MKRQPSLFQVSIIINPQLWDFNIVTGGIYIFSITIGFIGIQLITVCDQDLHIISEAVDSLPSDVAVKNDLSAYAPDKIKIVCMECAHEGTKFENEIYQCPKCGNDNDDRFIKYMRAKNI